MKFIKRSCFVHTNSPRQFNSIQFSFHSIKMLDLLTPFNCLLTILKRTRNGQRAPRSIRTETALNRDWSAMSCALNPSVSTPHHTSTSHPRSSHSFQLLSSTVTIRVGMSALGILWVLRSHFSYTSMKSTTNKVICSSVCSNERERLIQS